MSKATPTRRRFFRKTEAFQLLQAAGAEGLSETVLISPRPDYIVAFSRSEETPVDTRKALPLDLGSETGLDFAVGAGAVIKRYDLCSALPHAATEILTRDNEVSPLITLTSEQDMAMWMARFTVIDRDPIELRPEIRFHLQHEAANQRFQIPVLDRILGGNDETELVAIAVAPV